MIAVTQVADMAKPGSAGEPRSRIVVLDTEKPAKSVKVISSAFYSARSPEISFDGKSLLFTARQKQNDPWQIWEMNLGNGKIRKVTSSPKDCIDPAYLPSGRIVFSRLAESSRQKREHALFTCNPDGTDSRQITFNPVNYLASTVLRDGRLLAISNRIYPDPGNVMLTVLRPDGTKADMFYKGTTGSILQGRVRETLDGRLIFIESEKAGSEKGIVKTISYNQPLHTGINLTSENNGDFLSVFPRVSGNLLISYRPANSDRYAIYEADAENKIPGRLVFSDPGYDAVEVVALEKRERPKKLPSEVDMEVKTGLILCQDINFTGMQSPDINTPYHKAVNIEILGMDSTLGVVQVEKDGSFYLKVIADTPFRIQTLDVDGHVSGGPSDWLYLRPNERRGCIGCHEDPEMVPENRIPLSVKKAPVVIPVHVSSATEKEIELE